MMQLLMDWLTDIQKLSPATLKRLLRLGGKVAKLLDFRGQAWAIRPQGRHPAAR